MTHSITKKDLNGMITDWLEKQLQDAFDEEFDKMVERVKERRADIISLGAIRLAKNYNVSMLQESLIIEVRNYDMPQKGKPE